MSVDNILKAQQNLDSSNLSLKKLGFDIEKSTPTDTSISTLVADLTALGQTRNNTPANGLLQGIMAGLKSGSLSKKTEEKQKKYAAFAEMLRGVEETNRSMQERINAAKEKEALRETINPYAESAFGVLMSDAPQELKDKQVGETFKAMQTVVPQMQGSQYIGSIPNTSLFIYKDKNGNNQTADLRTFVNSDQIKALSKNYVDQQKIFNDQERLAVRKQEYNLHEKNAQTSENKLNLDERKFEQDIRKDIEDKFVKNINAYQKTYDTLNEIEKVANDNPKVFGAIYSKILNQSEADPKAWNAAALQIIEKTDFANKKDIEAAQLLRKHLNTLIVQKVEGFARANQFIEQIAAKGTASTTMSKGAFDEAIKKTKKDVLLDIKNAEESAYNYDSTKDKRIVKELIKERFKVPVSGEGNDDNKSKEAGKVENSIRANYLPKEGHVLIQAPDGSIFYVEDKNVPLALADGGKIAR